MTTTIEIDSAISSILSTTIHIKSFTSRWHSIRSQLLALSSLLPSITSSPHHSSNPLLTQTLIPNLTQTLSRIETLSSLCSDPTRTPSKLLMQSDLDMSIGWLAKQINDIELLLKSGVLNHSTAIVLATPNVNSTKEELICFVKDVFARLQIGDLGFKKKAMESLVMLMKENGKSIGLVAEEGNVGYLVNLLDLNGGNLVVLELAVSSVAMLARGGDFPRRRVFDEGGLGPLLRIVESGPVGMREKAAAAVEAIAADADSVWALSAYGGVPILVEACRIGSPAVQAHAVGALRNASVREDVRAALSENGAVSVLFRVLETGNLASQEKAADCISVMSMSDDVFRNSVKRENGLVRLMGVLRDGPGSDVAEHVLRAVYAISSTEYECRRVLSASAAFVSLVAEMIMHGNILLQQICCLVLSILSLSDGNKRAAAGCMPALLKLMECTKPDGMQEAAAAALVSLLTVRSNRKDLVKDEKCLVRLVNMLDPRQDMVAKELAVSVMSSVLAGGSEGCRKQVVEAGAQQRLQKLAEAGVVGAKKAVQRLSGNRLKSLFNRAWRDL